MISYITGQLGAGKTCFAVMKGARALLSGKVLATNINFLEGWEHLLLKHAPYYKIAGRNKRKMYREEIAERYFHDKDMETLLNLRLYGKGEGRGVRILDETHNALNNRDWEDKNQKVMLRKMTLSRKRGWDDYIIAQHSANTDAALRRVATVEIEVINWKQHLQFPLLHTPLLPFPVFLAKGYRLKLSGTSVTRVRKPVFNEMHLLGWWRNLYDTFEDFDIDAVEGSDEESRSPLWLPRRAEAHGASSAGGSAPLGGAVILKPRTTSYGVKSGTRR